MKRESDEECLLLIAAIKDRVGDEDFPRLAHSEVARLLGNLEVRIKENAYLKDCTEKSREHIKMVRDCLLHIKGSVLQRALDAAYALQKLHVESHLTDEKGDGALFLTEQAFTSDELPHAKVPLGWVDPETGALRHETRLATRKRRSAPPIARLPRLGGGEAPHTEGP